jgi:iron complex transport system substrate-binding protein
MAALLAAPALAAPRVYALDQCADQYVLALSPRQAIVGLSKRADDADAYFGAAARGLPQGRATTEAVLAARPQVVVRYWGGDERLTRTLERRGVTVVRVEDAGDFDGVAANVRRVAAALDARERGEGIVAHMRAQLAASRGAWRGQRALYLTPGGYTAGQGTLIDALLRAAGLVNIADGPGFQAVPLERLVLQPPAMLVEGFFDNAVAAFQRWSPGRHRLVRRLARGRPTVALPGTILGCPAWFAAEGSLRLARAR